MACAVRQQTITWTIVEPVYVAIWRHKAKYSFNIYCIDIEYLLFWNTSHETKNIKNNK